jgi:Histidine kinase-, DNA gyrase B-, and HSP90-like ATPase
MIPKRAKIRAEYTGEHLIALDKFIQATRDSGYKGTGSAVAELVDNAIQAGATQIDILVGQADGDANSLMLEVFDNGCGMSVNVDAGTTFWGQFAIQRSYRVR